MFGEQSSLFSFLETAARQVFGNYEYEELRAPLLEFTSLFQRSIGSETDVVRKEMFTFTDRKGRSLSLRPEATAGALRAFIESGRDKQPGIARLFSIGPMFRYERPQKGRMRQFHQINCECLGSGSPYIDAELICMLMDFLTRAEIKNLSLQINSLGCRECRDNYIQVLKEYLKNKASDGLCTDCAARLTTNPLRTLDCKEAGCREILAGVPRLLDYNCPSCQNHFSKALELLRGQGIEPHINHRLVRGLDYYCRTTFEVVSEDIGAQTAVAGGGRYDGLVRELGGEDTPGAGFACGMERLALLLDGRKTERRPDFYLACPDPENMEAAFSLTQELRKHNYSGEMNYAPAGFKKLMREAARLKSRVCLILGANEMASHSVMLKNMDTGEQEAVAMGRLPGALAGILQGRLPNVNNKR